MLSTPPAFILSQDQTLHKKSVKELSREKPKTQPKQTTPHNNAWPGNPKITKQTQQKGPSNIAAPPTRRKDNNKNPISHATNQRHHSINGSNSTDQHTPQKGMKQSHKPTKQNHWHTIEFSHNTRTPKHTPKILGPVQSGLTDPTHTHTTNKIACRANQVKGSTSDCFPTAISPESLSGGALSVTLTHIKLHTPNQQHKPAGEKGQTGRR